MPHSFPSPFHRAGNSPVRSKIDRPAGFTLVELLAVIAIVGILAGIVFGVVGGVRKKANQVRCISNLRQVGVALLGFVADNKGKLPGPLYLQVADEYGWKESSTLVFHLAPCLGYPDPAGLGSSTRVHVPLLHCPARGLEEGNNVGTFGLQCGDPMGPLLATFPH